MSPVADKARVVVLLADYAAADAIQKVNVLGAGWAVTGVDPHTGTTAPQCVVILIDTPPDLHGHDFTVAVTLNDESGTPVQLPGPAGTLQAMRVAQVVRAEEPTFSPEMSIPRGRVWAHTQIVLNLANGLPLTVGALYTWQLDIDGNSDPRWAVSFFVPGPRPGPVFGGPANPAYIPEMDPPG